MAPWQTRALSGSGRTRQSLQRMRGVLADLWVMKGPLVAVTALLIYLPLPLLVEGKESRCAYVLMVMATLWLTEALPIPVTALLPVVMFPLTGVLTAKDVAQSYVSNTSMLFIGGLIVAVGVEECNLHKRVALTVLRRVGADPKWIMLGLMLPTWFLSMWISNTATASMMIPIAQAVLQQIGHASGDGEGSESKSDSEGSTQEEEGESEEREREGDTFLQGGQQDAGDSCRVEIHPEKPAPEPEKRNSKERCEMQQRTSTKKAVEGGSAKGQRQARVAKALCLCIAYSANVGGIATLTGTPPNLVLKGQVDMFFDKYGASSPLSFVEWMGLGFPLSLMLLFFCWVWLVFNFLHGCCQKVDEREREAVTATIEQECRALGPMTFAEWLTLILFTLLALTWISRDPKFMPGWAVMFESGYVSDSTGAVLIAALFFVLPARKPHVFCWKSPIDGSGTTRAGGYVPLLSWKRVHEKLAWGVIVLLGGGFALAKACKVSGLSMWMGQQLSAFGNLDPWVLNLIICTAVAMATEVTSNVATATLLMPIVAELAVRVGVNPLYLMASSALATSFAFMMPVATPPNAIVFAHGHLSIPDMAKAGLVMNMVAVFCLTLAVNTWGDAIFGFSSVPDVMRNVTAVDVIATSTPAL